MKKYTCCFTGSRNIDKLNKKLLYEEIEKHIKKGYIFFSVGGALGFDTHVALAILEFKSMYQNIKLILVLPFLEQAKNWSENDIIIYKDIKKRADKIIYTSKNYFRGCYHLRNRYLVDNSQICIAYLNKNSGGTFYTVNYALSKNVAVINIGNFKN